MLFIHQCKDCKISSILKYIQTILCSWVFVAFCDIPDLLTTFAIKTINYEYEFLL